MRCKKEYILRRKVFKLGNPGGLVITLPKVWVEANELQEGEEIMVAFDNYDYLKVIPLRVVSDPRTKHRIEHHAKSAES